MSTIEKTEYHTNQDSIHPIQSPITPLASIQPLLHRKVVLLTTSLITMETIFNNGLSQNIYFFYRMFEAMGYLPFLIVNSLKKEGDTIPPFMNDVRMLDLETFASKHIPVAYYIELGMSVDMGFKTYIQHLGAKICKVYLGNILNIDIETPVFYPPMYFPHHVTGLFDSVLVSPHYYQHAQYARAINGLGVDIRHIPSIAPYVWDSQFLTMNGSMNFRWKPPALPKDDVFVIVEPNISFQKSSLIPLSIVEAWYRKNPTWKGRIILINGDRITQVPFFTETIYNTFDIVKAGLVEIRNRVGIHEILTEFPSAIPICHQWNNEYNYMVLEYFAALYPVIHNASDWKEFGYYYKESDISSAVERITSIREYHANSLEVYKSHADSLVWRHSPYNPLIHREWKKVLESS